MRSEKRLRDPLHPLNADEIHWLTTLKGDIDRLCAKSRSPDGTLPKEIGELRDGFSLRTGFIISQLHNTLGHLEQEDDRVTASSAVLSILRDVIALTPPPGEKSAVDFVVMQEVYLKSYLSLASKVLENPTDPGAVHTVFEGVTHFLSKRPVPEKIASTLEEEIVAKCLAYYEEYASRLIQTAASPIDLTTASGRSVQEESGDEFSRLIPVFSQEQRSQILLKKVAPLFLNEQTLDTHGREVALFVRGLSRRDREELQKAIEASPESKARKSALDIIRKENSRTAVLMAIDPEVLRKEVKGRSEKEKTDLAEESKVSVYSLSKYAGSPGAVMIVLKELFQEDPPPISHDQLGSFALRWAQAHQRVTLPQKREDQGSFQRETEWIREKLAEMAQDLAYEHRELAEENTEVPEEFKNLPEQLQQAASSFCTPSAEAALPPGQEPATRVVQDAIRAGKSSETYKGAVKWLANDLFQISAATFTARSPGALALAMKNPAEVMDVKTSTGLTTYVATTILDQENPGTPQALEGAQETFVFWLDVAEESLKRGDYNTATAIAGALGSGAVERLILDKSTNAYLIDPSDSQKWKKILAQINPERGYAAPRAAVQEHIKKHELIIPPVLMPVAEVMLCGEGEDVVRTLGNAISLVKECQDSIGAFMPQPQTTTIVGDIRLEEGFTQGNFDTKAYGKSLKLRPKPPSLPRR